MGNARRTPSLFVALVGFVLGMIGAGFFLQPGTWPAIAKFSKDLAGEYAPSGKVRINQAHVFRGEINESGKAVGFHHRPGGVDPASARVTQFTSRPNARGIYRARVAVLDPATNNWVPKGPASTFYPDAWSKKRVVSEIEGAFENQVTTPGKPDNYWEGISPSRVRIGGYLDSAGNINAAFPID